MDEGLSSIPQDTADFDHFGTEPVSDDDDDPAEKENRDRELEEDFENLENEFSCNDQAQESSSDDDSDSSKSDSEYSNEESVLSNRSQFEHGAEQSSIKEFETSAQPIEPDLALNRLVIPPIIQYSALTESDVNNSKGLDLNYLKNYNENELKNPEEHYSEESNVIHSSHSNLNDSRTSDVNHSEMEDANISNISASAKSNRHFTHSTKNLQKHIESKSDDFDDKSHTFQTLTNANSVKYEVGIHDQHDYGDVSSRISPSQYYALLEDYKLVQGLYNTKTEEMKQRHTESKRTIQKLEKDNKSLKLQLENLKGERDKLIFQLQDTKDKLSVISQENNDLKRKLEDFEFQFDQEQKAKIDAQSKLQSAEITIQTLQHQLKELNQPDNYIRLQHQNENVIKDLKTRHQKEVVKYKETIDKLQENLNLKIAESENFSSKLSQLQAKYDELKIEKCDTFNKLSAKLAASQKEYQELLESGTVPENARLKLQLQHLQEVNSKLEKQNAALKDDVRSLEGELKIYETIKTSFEKEPLLETKKSQNNHHESDSKAEFKNHFKIIHSLRVQNNTLKQKLEESQKLLEQLSIEDEKAKLCESQYKESETKCRELEKKAKSLENELAECQKKLQELAQLYKELHSYEAKLQEENKSLKSTIAEISEKNIEQRNEIEENLRKSFLEKYESAVANLTSKTDSDKEKLRREYENKIALLEKEIQSLNDGLYDSKAQYVKIFEKNQELETKINSMSQSKEREEIVKEIKIVYEKKFKKKEEEIQKHKLLFESTLKSEVEKQQVEWAVKKTTEVAKFISKIKEELDAEYVKCLDQEKSKLEAEKKKILDECQEKVNNLLAKHETEKSNLRKNLQLKWESEIKKLQQSHQAEIISLTEKFEKERSSLENEIKILKEKNKYDFEQEAEKESLHKEVVKLYEIEKNNFEAQLRENFQKKWENGIKNMLQCHENEKESLTKSFQKKIIVLEDKIHVLEKNLLKEPHLEEIQKEHTNTKLAWENEKMDLIKNEHLLKNRISTALEIEKKLMEKIKKLKRYIRSLEETHKENNYTLEKEIEELKKCISDKENELQLVKKEYDTCKLALEKKHNKSFHIRNSASQTEDKVVPMKTLLNLYDAFKNLLTAIKETVKEYQKRGAERLQRALYFYHDYLTSKKDACSIATNIGIPRVNRNLKSSSSIVNQSPLNAMQQQLNSNYKIANSTPLQTVTSNVNHKNLEYQMNDVSTVRVLQNGRSTPDFGNGFADMSFDYLPIRMQNFEQTSVKLPTYSAPGGVFHGEHVIHSYPPRDSPLSQIK